MQQIIRQIPMPPADSLFVGLEKGERALPATVSTLARFGGAAPGLERLRDRVTRRWGLLRRLRLTIGPSCGPRTWLLPERFHTVHHVVETRQPTGCGLDEVVGRLVSDALPKGRPPWQLHLIADPHGERFALLLRAHHALLDGPSMATALRLLLDSPHGGDPDVPVSALAAIIDDQPAATRRAMLAALRGHAVPARHGALHARTGKELSVTWRTVPADTVSTACHAVPGRRTTINDVFLAAVTAAVRANPLLLGTDPALRGVRALVPFDLRTLRTSDALGNAAVPVRVPLPAHLRARQARLEAVHEHTIRIKKEQRAAGGALLPPAAARISTRALDAFAAYLYTPLCCTLQCGNVRMGEKPLALDGRPLTRVSMTPFLTSRQGLAVHLTSYADVFTVTVLSDLARRRHAGPLADAIEREIRILAALAGPLV